MLITDTAWSQIDGTRKSQQDRVAALTWPNGFQLLLLADGMGGVDGGDIAAERVLEEFKKHFIANSQQLDMHQRLLEALDAANKALFYEVKAQPQMAGMGTTLIAVTFDGQSIQWLSVGDSPLWLIRNNELQRLNQNHSMAAVLQQQVAEGKLTEQYAKEAPERSQLLEAVMGKNISLVDAPHNEFELQPGDWLILASDGVETCSTETIVQIQQRCDATDDTSETFINALFDEIIAQARSSQDNASLLVMKVKEVDSDESPTVQPKSNEPVTAHPKIDSRTN